MNEQKVELLNPVLGSNRIVTLDILRGFAIFGILFINVLYFCNQFIYMSFLPKIWAGSAHKISYYGMKFIFEGKFFSIFSFLFGLGFAMQLERFRQKNLNFNLFYFRRLIILLLIGLAHAFVFFYGDILSIYAIVGILMLFVFKKLKPKTILASAIMMFVVFIGINGYQVLHQKNQQKLMKTNPKIAQEKMKEQVKMMTYFQKAGKNYKDGSFVDVMSNNYHDYMIMLPAYATQGYGFMIFGMFLLGLYAGKSEFYKNIKEKKQKLKKILWVSLPVGLIANGLYVWVLANLNPAKMFDNAIIRTLGYAIGIPALALSYMIILVLFLQRERVARIFKPMASVGKMALTAYIMQSILFGLFFYGYGFGFFQKVGPWHGIIVALGVYLIIMVFANLWFKFFRFGPLEWLWRTLTYLKRQPLKR